jgi:RimJ/RimL family protein N-acetyltransferase
MVSDPTHIRSAPPGRDDRLPLHTASGPVTLRPEQAEDAGFLLALFRSHVPRELAALPVDAAVRESLVRMQFNAQAASYRAQFPAARFDIVERDGIPIGRIVIDAGTETGCIVDFALMPGVRGRGLGVAILDAVLRHLAPLGRPVRCKVLTHNTPSLRMCQRVGFRRIGGEPPFLQLEWRPAI